MGGSSSCSGGGKPDIPRFEGLARQKEEQHTRRSAHSCLAGHTHAPSPSGRSLPAKNQNLGSPRAARCTEAQFGLRSAFFPSRPFWRSESVAAAGSRSQQPRSGGTLSASGEKSSQTGLRHFQARSTECASRPSYCKPVTVEHQQREIKETGRGREQISVRFRRLR